MITIRDVPEPGTVDLFEDGLLLPIPSVERNTILLEDRDGEDVRRLTAKAAAVDLNGKKLASMSDMRIDVYVTDARVAIACSKFDKGGGWTGMGTGALVAVAFNAGSKILAANRRRGKMLVGQARYPWIASAGSTSRIGMFSSEGLYIKVKSPDGILQLRLDLPKNIDAASVAAEVARRAAIYRLACEPAMDAEKRAALEPLTKAERIEPEKGMVRYHVLPFYQTLGEDSGRLLPAVLGAGRRAAVTAPPAALGASTADTASSAAAAVAVAPPPGPPAGTTGFCTSCGSATKPGLSFCTQCGARLATA
jgi:hypothetical protein